MARVSCQLNSFAWPRTVDYAHHEFINAKDVSAFFTPQSMINPGPPNPKCLAINIHYDDDIFQ